ncbi:MAG: T9SS type A sorting domain-containing protein [Bacteroidetes bacterium]|nr:T9SS type A sorting domain-containing protein [Bacteroidota bacterium]
MRVDYMGNQIWGHEFSYSTTDAFDARDIIESPYGSITTPEVIVVGHSESPYSYPQSSAADGFFLRLNATNGNVINDVVYNQPAPLILNYEPVWAIPYIDSDNWFSSIEIADSPTGGSTSGGGKGFVLGGQAVMPGMLANYDYPQWVCKLDPTGIDIWSSLIEPSWATFGTWSGMQICRVQERYNTNTAPPTYEYYATGSKDYAPATELVVYKLDDNGDVLSFPPTTDTEFHYAALTTPAKGLSNYGDLSLIETGGLSFPDGGFQAYGTTVGNPSNDMIVKAYFNGESNTPAGCNANIQKINGVHKAVIKYPDYSFGSTFQTAAIGQCGSILLSQLTNLITAAPCTTPLNTNGSNARALSLTNYEQTKEDIKLFPNPIKSNVILSMPVSKSGQAFVYNSTGQLVKAIDFDNTEEVSIDFAELKLPSGFYVIKVKTKTAETTFKAIYNPE